MIRNDPLLKSLLGAFIMAISFVTHATQLLREPTLHKDTLVFTYANDLWKTTIKGGKATRLTSFQGSESQPVISPDGKMLAFTGEFASCCHIISPL